MNVKYVGWGILKDSQDNEYTDNGIGHGTVSSLTTGELFKITARDENGNPTEIEYL